MAVGIELVCVFLGAFSGQLVREKLLNVAAEPLAGSVVVSAVAAGWAGVC
jgi:hypothetical protein